MSPVVDHVYKAPVTGSDTCAYWYESPPVRCCGQPASAHRHAAEHVMDWREESDLLDAVDSWAASEPGTGEDAWERVLAVVHVYAANRVARALAAVRVRVVDALDAPESAVFEARELPDDEHVVERAATLCDVGADGAGFEDPCELLDQAGVLDPCELAPLEEQALQWVPCADCLETGAGDGDACEECGGWGMRTPTRAEAQLAEEAGVLPDHERPLPWSNS